LENKFENKLGKEESKELVSMLNNASDKL